MITSRNLFVDPPQQRPTAGIKRESPFEQEQKLSESITIRRRIDTPFGSLKSTVTLEALTYAGEVIRSESFTVQQPVTFASIVGRVDEFRYTLINDGYAIKELSE